MPIDIAQGMRAGWDIAKPWLARVGIGAGIGGAVGGVGSILDERVGFGSSALRGLGAGAAIGALPSRYGLLGLGIAAIGGGGGDVLLGAGLARGGVGLYRGYRGYALQRGLGAGAGTSAANSLYAMGSNSARFIKNTYSRAFNAFNAR